MSFVNVMSYIIYSIVFQSVVASAHYPQFLQDAMRVFLKLLQEGTPQFIAEHNGQVGGLKFVCTFLPYLTLV